MRRRPPEHTRTDTRFPSTTLFRSTVQDRRRIVAISRGEPAAYRRGAALFGLHVCRGRQLYRARLAHLRFPLHPLSARLGDLGARDGDLCQFLCAPLAARHSLAALRGNRATVLALSGMVSPAACPPPHAAARRLGPRRAVHLVRREYRHLRPRLALSEPGSRLADGRNRKAGKLVSADDHQLRAGQPGAAAAGAGYTPMIRSGSGSAYPMGSSSDSGGLLNHSGPLSVMWKQSSMRMPNRSEEQTFELQSLMRN